MGVKEREERERGTGGNTRLQECAVKSKIQTKRREVSTERHRNPYNISLFVPAPFVHMHA